MKLVALLLSATLSMNLAIAAPECETEFGEMLTQYVSTWHGKSGLDKAKSASRVRSWVFRNPGSPEYIEALRAVDAMASVEPEAAYDLARSLQLSWEARYARGLSERRARNSQIGDQTGFAMGAMAVMVLSAAMARNPAAAPRYFRAYRHFLPLAGTLIGHSAATVTNGMLTRDLPVSPAHVMSLGISSDEYSASETEIHHDLVATSAGLAVSTLVWTERAMIGVRALRAANVAATPAKINPVALVTSIAIGFLVEKGVKRGLDEAEYRSLLDAYLNEINALLAAADAKDEALAYTHAEGLVKRAMNLAAYLDRPISEAVIELDEASNETSNLADVARVSPFINPEQLKSAAEQARANRIAKATENLEHKIRDARTPAGDALRDSHQILIEAAATIRGLGKVYLEDQANVLEATAHKGEGDLP